MRMNRRTFLGASISAGLLTAGGAFLPGCGGITRGDLPRRTGEPKGSSILDERRRRVLYCASLAPSGHNAQPWSVRAPAPDEWIISFDPQRLLPEVDPENRETLLSLGAFAENLTLAAGAMGLRADIEVMARSNHDPEVMRVRLRESRPSAYPLARLKNRMTVKQNFLDREISAPDIKALAAPLDGHLHYFPRGTKHARCIEEGAVEAFRRQSARDCAQRELVRWLRLGNESARRHRDGLTPEGMGMTGFKGWFVRNFVSPEDFLKPSFRAKGVENTAALAAQGAGWIILTGSGSAPAELIDSGRRFERMALLAREHRLAVHPMSQLLEERWGLDKVAANHSADMSPCFVLRVGYLANYPDPVSLRRPVEAFLREA